MYWQVGAALSHQIRYRHLAIALGHDECPNHLTIEWVLDSNHGTCSDAFARIKPVLNLDGRDGFPASLDQILTPSAKLDACSIYAPGGVAGTKPPVDKRR